MKKILLTLLLMLALVNPVFSADTKITGLDADTAPTNDDLVITVDAPGGTPANKKVTIANLSKAIDPAAFAIASQAGGDIFYASSASAWARLAKGTAYQILHVNSDTPGWTSTLGATGTRLTKGWFTDLEITNAPSVNGVAAQATNGLMLNLMTGAGDILYGGASGVTTRLAAGTDGYILQAKGAAAPQWVNSLSGLSFDIGSSAASGHAVTMDANGVLQTAFANLLPDAADGAALGSATYEWSDLYLADGGVIYFQNDQSVYLTPTAGTLTLTGAFVATTSFEAPYLILGSAATAADAGAIRLPNAAYIMAEADAAGTDISVIGVDSGEIIQIGASGASSVNITPAVTVGSTFRSAAVASPYIGIMDSDAAGADYTDEETVKIYAQQTTTTEDAEVGDFRIAAVGAATAGTWYTHIFWDGSDQILKLGTMTDADAPAAVADHENLKIDFNTATDNEISIDTDSGATTLNFNALSMVTTGTIRGAVNVVVTTDGALSPTAAQMYGTMFIADHATATSDTTYTLPAAVAGMSACFYDNGGGTGGIIIEIDGSDVIILDGLALDAGDTIDSPGVAGDGANGDFICLLAIDATNWITLGRSGTWVDGGAT